MVLAAWQRLGGAAAAGVLHGVGAEVPVDNNVWRTIARGNVVMMEVAVRAHCREVGRQELSDKRLR